MQEPNPADPQVPSAPMGSPPAEEVAAAAPGVAAGSPSTPSAATAPAGGPAPGVPPAVPPYRGSPPPPPPPLPARRPTTGGGGSRGPRRSSSTGWLWALGLVAVVGLLGLLTIAYAVSQLNFGGTSGFGGVGAVRQSDLREIVVEPAPTRNKIAVIEIDGVISGETWDAEGNSLVTHLREQLDRAGEDRHVKAVLFRIESPGGEVLASDEIYKLVAEFQEEHDKPVIASMGSVAASGGYYVAAPCRWIVAHEMTITGSIGVVMQTYNWRLLMEKVGVRPQVFKSGKLKDMLSPNKLPNEITEEEREIVQDLVDETFERFQAVVEEGRGLARAQNEDNDGDAADRGRKLAEEWKSFTDGRLLSGKEAWRLGFVDELGDFEMAVARALKLAGIEEAKLVKYLRPARFGSLLSLLVRSEPAQVRVDLGLDLPKRRAGLYFLAPTLAR